MANPESFKDRVLYYCRSVTIVRGPRLGHPTQSDLAHEIIMDPGDFSKRLNGKSDKHFSCHEIKCIIEVLAEWKAITTQEQAIELLDLTGCEHFSQAQWNAGRLSKLARSSGNAINNQMASDTVHTKHAPLTGEQKDRWQTAPRLIREYTIVHYRFVIGALLSLIVVIASSLTGLTLLHSYIESMSLKRVDWNNFIYPGLCNSNQGGHVTVRNGTAIDSGSLGRFFVQVYAPTTVDPTTFGDLTGDGQSEAIVPYGCSDTDLNRPTKGTVYVHALIFSGDVAHPVVLGQFPALSGQVNRDFTSVDYVYIDHEELHLFGEGFSGVKSTMFDQQITLTYRWVGNQFEKEYSKTEFIASLLPRLGSNGQQLAYACPGMVDMEVQGVDQDKKNATWRPNQVLNGGLTWEWWWMGPVRIQWKDQAGKVHEDDHVFMPQQYTTYVYHAACI